MKTTNLIKPFGQGNYISPDKALKQIEKMPDAPELKQQKNNLDDVIISLDFLPADNGSRKNQKEWIEYWNKIKNGKLFASMPDFYQTFKVLKRYSEDSTISEGKIIAEDIVSGLREDCDWNSNANLLLSSTRIFLNTINDMSSIIHHYGAMENYCQRYDLKIPNMPRINFLSVMLEGQGLEYISKLFDTIDSPETIATTLEFISGKDRNNIEVMIPFRTKDDDELERMAGFVLSSERNCFYICGDIRFEEIGRARGVAIKNTK